MDELSIKETKALLSFIEKSPTAYQAAESAAELLRQNGFSEVNESAPSSFAPGKYFIVRSGTSVIAFTIPSGAIESCMITASHSDSPTFKLKSSFESEAFGTYLRLNTEPYGGMILSSWFDRPLSVAGRVVVRCGERFAAKTFRIDRDLAVIPSVCIHFNRAVNDGSKINPAVDTLPLFGTAADKGALLSEIAETLGVNPEDIVSHDLYLYNRTPGTIFGAQNEFFASPRIDNLQCAYATLRGFLSAENDCAIKVWCMFDNEETGSSTKQGAGSAFLRDTLEKIARDNGLPLPALLDRSMMVSADNGHAKHPNHPELSDAQNAPQLGGGVVIKYNAAQRYTTDGVSAALFAEICSRAGVPVQRFANRSDLPGGSTLGSISNTKVPLCTVDIGLAQLSMHSSYETGGTADTAYMIRTSECFYKTSIERPSTDEWILK